MTFIAFEHETASRPGFFSPEREKERKLVLEVAAALALGIFIVITRFERLFLISLVLVPILLRREWLRIVRTGSFAQTGLVVGILFAVALGAAALPKHPDQYLDDVRVALPSQTITLGSLQAIDDPHLHVLPGSIDSSNRTQRILLSTANPTLRELTRAIEKQTGLRSSLPSGTGRDATILWGIPWPHYVKLSKARTWTAPSDG
jgi:hypothetical protein